MPGGGDRCASHVLRSNQGSAAVVAMHAERHSPPLRHRPTVSPHPPFKPAANTRTAPAFPVPQTPLRLPAANWLALRWWLIRSEEHTSELQSLMSSQYADFC